MKKLYIAGIVFLISLLAVSAGEFPDDDNDGICETPFCDKLDLCPKVACEQLGIPVENCQDPNNKDSDGDGAGDVCDQCPSDPKRVQEPCTPPPRQGGGGGGAGAAGCRSKTDFNAQFHQSVDWSCITDTDCQNIARKQGKDPSRYLCTVTNRQRGAGAVQNACQCAMIRPAGPLVGGPAPEMPVGVAQMELRRQSPQVPPPAPQQQAPQSVPYVPQPSPSGGIAPIIILAALAVLGALAYLFIRRRQ